MKKLLRKYTGILSLLSFLLILPVHYAHSQNVDELFGIKLFDNATNYVSSEYIENNKFKDTESISGFWTLYMGDKVSSPYFELFFTTIDNYNTIHQIKGKQNYISEDRCVEFLHVQKINIENKKQVILDFHEKDYGKARITSYVTSGDSNNITLNIKCIHKFDPIDNYMMFSLSSEALINAREEYYSQD